MAVHKQRGVYIPDEPGRKHVPMVGPGISVWAIIDVSRLYDWDLQKVTGNWEGYLTEADVRAAWHLLLPPKRQAALHAAARPTPTPVPVSLRIRAC